MAQKNSSAMGFAIVQVRKYHSVNLTMEHKGYGRPNIDELRDLKERAMNSMANDLRDRLVIESNSPLEKALSYKQSGQSARFSAELVVMTMQEMRDLLTSYEKMLRIEQGGEE